MSKWVAAVGLGRTTQKPCRAALVVALAALVAVGCEQQKDPSGGADTESAAATPAGGADSCDEFVGKLCAAGGDESIYCASGKTLAPVLPPSTCKSASADFAELERRIQSERKPCNDLMERLCQDVGANTDACQRVRAQTPQFPREQCEELVGQYPQILAELRQQEAQYQPLPADARERIAAKGAPSFGPEDAKVTIVEFSDFECPFCSRAADVVEKIRERYGDKVRFVFRQFPLPSHENAHLAAQASLAAHEQGKFWEYHDLLFANQRALSRDSLEDYARQVNLNLASFERALDSGAHKAAVERDSSLGEGVQVNGTPTVFINGRRVPNPTDFEAVAKLIDEELGA